MKNCSLVFRERISKDTYIYLEELLKLSNFTLHPKATIDIEKPASVSKDHALIWRFPFQLMVEQNEWVTNTHYLDVVHTDDGKTLEDRKNQTLPEEYPIYLRSEARFDYHMRY